MTLQQFLLSVSPIVMYCVLKLLICHQTLLTIQLAHHSSSIAEDIIICSNILL